MSDQKKLEQLEDELKVMKNEIRQALLDIREHMLTRFMDPFNRPATAAAPQQADKIPGLEGSADRLLPDADQSPGLGSSMGTSPRKSPGADISPRNGGSTSPAGHPAENIKAAPGKQNGHGSTGPASASGTRKEREESAVQESQQGSEEEEPVDLVTIASLSRWVTSGMKRVGRERLEKIVGLYGLTGRISPLLKEVLTDLINLEEMPEISPRAGLKDSIAVLADLDSLLTRLDGDRGDAAILALCFNGKEV